RHTSFSRDWSSDVCSSDLGLGGRKIRGGRWRLALVGRARHGPHLSTLGTRPVGPAPRENREQVLARRSARPKLPAVTSLPEELQIGRAAGRERGEERGCDG